MAFSPAFLLFSVAVAASPGPNNLMAVAAGAAQGPRGAFPMLLGIWAGAATVALAIGAGMGLAMGQGGPLQPILRGVGALYLVWLGVKLLRAALADGTVREFSPLGWREAALFQFINPRAWLSPASVAAAFGGPTQADTRITIAAYTLINCACIGGWMLAGGLLRGGLHDGRAVRVLNLALGGLTVLSAGLMFL